MPVESNDIRRAKALEAEYDRLRDDLRYGGQSQIAYLTALATVVGALFALYSTESWDAVGNIPKAASPLVPFGLTGIFFYSATTYLLTDKHARIVESQLAASRLELYMHGGSDPSAITRLHHRALGPSPASRSFAILIPLGYGVYLGALIGVTVAAILEVSNRALQVAAYVLYGLLFTILLRAMYAFSFRLSDIYARSVRDLERSSTVAEEVSGSSASVEQRVRGRIRLSVYLLFPRPMDGLIKAAVFTVGGGLVLVLSVGELDAQSLRDIAVITLMYEGGLYSARYLVNDALGIRGDTRLTHIRSERRLSDFDSDLLALPIPLIAVSCAAIRAGVALGYLTYRYDRTAILVFVLFLVPSILYEVQSDRLKKSANVSLGAFGLWASLLLLGGGYSIRSLAAALLLDLNIPVSTACVTAVVAASSGLSFTLAAWVFQARKFEIDLGTPPPSLRVSVVRTLSRRVQLVGEPIVTVPALASLVVLVACGGASIGTLVGVIYDLPLPVLMAAYTISAICGLVGSYSRTAWLPLVGILLSVGILLLFGLSALTWVGPCAIALVSACVLLTDRVV